MNFASLSLRFLAASLDFILCKSLVLFASAFFPDVMLNSASIMTLAAYWLIMVAWFQTTLGGMVLGIKITAKHGEPLSKAHMALRLLPELAVFIGLQMLLPSSEYGEESIFSYVEWMTYTPLLAYMLCMLPALFTKEKTTLFDILCNTRFLETSTAPLFYTPAPIWRRLVAYAIDSVLVMAVTMALDFGSVFLIEHFASEGKQILASRVILMITNGITLTFLIAYWAVLPTLKWRGTLGMKWLGLQFTFARTDQAPTILQLLTRGLYGLAGIVLFLCLAAPYPNIIWAFTQGNQASNLVVEELLLHPDVLFYLVNAVLLSQFLSIISLALIFFTRERASLFDILSKVRIMHSKKPFLKIADA